MHSHRPYLYFTLVFVISGAALGVLWVYHELRKPAPIVTITEEASPFQTPEEALEQVPEQDADHVRSLLASDEPIAPESIPPVSNTPPVSVASPMQVQTRPGNPQVAVVYDASEELENTHRLIDSYAPFRDPSVSLDSPANRKAINEMMRNAAIRATKMPASMPRPTR